MGREAQGEWAKGKGPKSQGLGTCSRSGGRWGSDGCGPVSLAGFPAGHEAWGPGGGLFVENGSKAGLLNLLFSNLCFLTCATALLRPSPLPGVTAPRFPGHRHLLWQLGGHLSPGCAGLWGRGCNATTCPVNQPSSLPSPRPGPGGRRASWIFLLA